MSSKGEMQFCGSVFPAYHAASLKPEARGLAVDPHTGFSLMDPPIAALS